MGRGRGEQERSDHKGARLRRGRAVAVWLDEGDIARLKEVAQEMGIGHTTLMRMWLRERLRSYQSSGRTSGSEGG
jgi:transposase-like protein